MAGHAGKEYTWAFKLVVWQSGNQEQGKEGEEDRREDGETALPPTLAQLGLGQRKAEEDGINLSRVTSDSGWCSHEWEWVKLEVYQI